MTNDKAQMTNDEGILSGIRRTFVCRHICPALTGSRAFDYIVAVKWFALILVMVLFAAANSCTTLVTRRDLYSPEPGPDSFEARRQWVSTTTTTTTQMRANPIERDEGLPLPASQFR
jgi:hypothetical protein